MGAQYLSNDITNSMSGNLPHCSVEIFSNMDHNLMKDFVNIKLLIKS